MGVINTIDIGLASLLTGPTGGQETGSALITGKGRADWATGAKSAQRSPVVSVRAPSAIGGQAAGSKAAVLYVLRQLQELAQNPDLQPCLIQWASGETILATDRFDGWYRLDNINPLDFSWTNHVPTQIVATWVSPSGTRRIFLFYVGGALSTGASGAPLNLLAMPVGSTAMEASFTRTGAEGAIPCILGPVASPMPIVLSSTLSQIFQGGVHVYDTINTATNPVPTTGGFVHASWVEVFGPNHLFEGDCVLTNGLQLLLFQAGQAQIAKCYLWSTGLATIGWQNYANLKYQDNAGSATTLRSFTLVTVGMEECALDALTSNAKASNVRIRLQRGRYEVRCDFMPLSESNTSQQALVIQNVSTTKIDYNSGSICDNVLAETSPTPTADYLYGAGFTAGAGSPYIFGWLYQNAPATSQPFRTASGLGDSSGPAVNARRSYAFFAIPFGVNATYSPANLQQEAETGTLGAGWTSVADAAGSAGNTAQLATGTAAGNTDTIGVSWTPPAGTYILAVRYRNSGAPTNALEAQVGALIAGVFTQEVGVGSGNGSKVAYGWLRSAIFALTGAQTFQFQIKSGTAAATVNHFFDEIVLLPVTLTTDNRGPQDLWQQFIYDRQVRMVRQ